MYKQLDLIHLFQAFDLTNCWCAGGHNHRASSGDLQLNIKLSTAATEPLKLIIVACYENNISILDREVTLDYTV